MGGGHNQKITKKGRRDRNTHQEREVRRICAHARECALTASHGGMRAGWAASERASIRVLRASRGINSGWSGVGVEASYRARTRASQPARAAKCRMRAGARMGDGNGLGEARTRVTDTWEARSWQGTSGTSMQGRIYRGSAPGARDLLDVSKCRSGYPGENGTYPDGGEAGGGREFCTYHDI